MKILLALLMTLSIAPAFSSVEVESTPFTYIKFGWMPVRGDYIQVKNPEFFDEEKTHFLIEVEGVDYKDIIKQAKALYGKNYKCRIAEHFTETMRAIGINVTDKVDLKLYLFDWGHKVFDLKDIPSTEDNVYEIQFSDEQYCN